MPSYASSESKISNSSSCSSCSCRRAGESGVRSRKVETEDLASAIPFSFRYKLPFTPRCDSMEALPFVEGYRRCFRFSLLGFVDLICSPCSPMHGKRVGILRLHFPSPLTSISREPLAAILWTPAVFRVYSPAILTDSLVETRRGNTNPSPDLQEGSRSEANSLAHPNLQTRSP